MGQTSRPLGYGSGIAIFLILLFSLPIAIYVAVQFAGKSDGYGAPPVLDVDGQPGGGGPGGAGITASPGPLGTALGSLPLGSAAPATPRPVGGLVAPISERYFSDGTISVQVVGLFEVATDIELYAPASYGDGQMTWIQFGEGFTDTHTATVTVDPSGEAAVTVSSGNFNATGDVETCAVDIDVSDALVAGTLSCHDVIGFDSPTGAVGPVQIEVTFSAAS